MQHMLQYQYNKIHFSKCNKLFIHNFETLPRILNNTDSNLNRE